MVQAKGRDRSVAIVVLVQAPSLVRLLRCGLSTPEEDVVLTSHSLTVKDEKGCDTSLAPQVQTLSQVCLYPSQAVKRWKQRLMCRRIIEEVAQIVFGVNCNGTIVELRDLVSPNGGLSKRKLGKMSEVIRTSPGH